jgi:hypothetical protein
MKSLSTKLVLSALGVALVAAPAFAKSSQHTTTTSTQGLYNSVQTSAGPSGTDPDPQIRSELIRDAAQSSGSY